MAADPYEALRAAFVSERPAWVRVEAYLTEQLSRLTRERYIPAKISARTKEVSSLVLKAHLKQRHDLSSFHDRCAARISVTFADQMNAAVALVTEHFDCPDGPDDKGLVLGTDGIGYRGVHCDVKLDRSEVDVDEIDGDVWCEIQIHTLASELWAAAGHDLGYKSTIEPPAPIARLINRLSALTEVFDSELVTARSALEAHPDFPTALLERELASVFYGVSGRMPQNRESSDAIVRQLAPLLNEPDAGTALRLREFAKEKANADRLRSIYESHDPATFDLPLLLSPAVMLVFEWLTRNEPVLREAWRQVLPEGWLDDLLVAWGGLDD